MSKIVLMLKLSTESKSFIAWNNRSALIYLMSLCQFVDDLFSCDTWFPIKDWKHADFIFFPEVETKFRFPWAFWQSISHRILWGLEKPFHLCDEKWCLCFCHFLLVDNEHIKWPSATWTMQQNKNILRNATYNTFQKIIRSRMENSWTSSLR